MANYTVTSGQTLEPFGDTPINGKLIVDQGGKVEVGQEGGAPVISADSIDNSGLVDGYRGSLETSGAFTNEANGGIEATGGQQPSFGISAATFDNLGTLEAADATLTVTVAAHGFANLSGGTLGGGVYEAASLGTVDFDVGGIVTTDAAYISLSPGGEVQSYDSSKSAYEPIEDTMTTVASSGTLRLVDRQTAWETPLTLAGTLQLIGGSLNAPKLTVDAGSAFEGSGSVEGPVTDNGVITGLPAAVSAQFKSLVPANSILEFANTVSGTGSVVAGHVTFDAAASANVIFPSAIGALYLDDPAEFTGTITPAGWGDEILLPSIATSEVTSYAYVPHHGEGVLKINLWDGLSLSLTFVGNYDLQSFGFGQTRANNLSSYYLVITSGAPATPQHDFLGAELSDILVENAAGQLDVGQLKNGSIVLSQIDTLGSQWSIVGTDDYLHDAHDQILIENAAGSVGIGEVSGGDSIHFTTILSGPGTGRVVESFGGEFLLENASGQVALASTTGGQATVNAITTLGSQWSFVGAGDYLGLGHDQVLIENTAGNVGVGTITSNSASFSTVATGLTAWKIVESGDFLGDGKSDFLLDNATTGQIEVGEVVNGQATFTVIDTLGPQWKIVGAGDYLGDGLDQIMIENTAGSVGVGEVANGTIHFTTVATGFSEWMFH